MIRYVVSLEVRSSLRPAVAAYMQREHIAEVVATGHFVHAEFEDTDQGFRTTYFAASREALDRYLAENTDHLRAKFMEAFPDGVVASREILSE